MPSNSRVRCSKSCVIPRTTLILSVVSFWEMQIKAALGRLVLRIPLARLIEEQQARNGLLMLPVSLEHVLTLDTLGDHHRDPFDRLLLAQAIVDGATLVSKDEMLGRYDVPLLWG